MKIDDIAEKIGVPLDRWETNCHAIAVKLLEAGIVKGRVVRGHYQGKIHPNSAFYGKPLVPHSWIELEDGIICDPTRWCFEQAYPYLYQADYSEDYDIGGDNYRENFAKPCPKITAKEKDQIIQPFDNPEVWAFVSSLIYGQMAFSKTQLFWLANRSKETLFPFTKKIYQGLEAAGMKAAIPIDNYRYVMGI